MCLDPDDMDEQLKYMVHIIPKSSSLLMRVVGWFLGDEFMLLWWTTYRLPFRQPVIAYPDGEQNPLQCARIIRHEMFHVRALAPWYGPLWMALCVTVFPLPVWFSGRWWIERRAYLDEIQQGLMTVDEAVETLWHGYGMPRSKSGMRKWFNKQLEKASAVAG